MKKTNVKTSIKGNENIIVKESVQQVYNELLKKPSFIFLTKRYNEKESMLIIRKSAMKMVSERP